VDLLALGTRARHRTAVAQRVEAGIAVQALNGMAALGMP
jgi:hypothetical protein